MGNKGSSKKRTKVVKSKPAKKQTSDGEDERGSSSEPEEGMNGFIYHCLQFWVKQQLIVDKNWGRWNLSPYSFVKNHSIRTY